MSRRKRTSDRTWYRTGEAATALGVHADTLRRLRPDLRQGVHYRVVSPKHARRIDYRWNVAKIEEYFATPPERR